MDFGRDSTLRTQEEHTQIRTVKYLAEQQEGLQPTFRDTHLEHMGKTDALTKCIFQMAGYCIDKASLKVICCIIASMVMSLSAAGLLNHGAP